MLALTSALLLILAFPPFGQAWAAWVALVPWLRLLRDRRPRAAFGWSYAIGLAFFLGSIWWLIHVTLLGWLLLCAYLALYFALFGVCTSRLFASHCSLVTSHFLIPATWVLAEYFRSHLLTGFGWNLLAYSQSPWLPVIQIADLTGAWGISFVIVLVNVGIASFLVSGLRSQVSGLLACVVLCVALTLSYGAWRMCHLPEGPLVRIAVIQGNIPQEQKWDEGYQEEIVRRYERLTREAAASSPDLIVWPETSVPGYLGLEDPITPQMLELARAVERPLLVGAPRAQLEPSIQWRVTNAAALLTPDGTIAQWHDKLHLVPFGEFIPFERTFPWLRGVLPPIGDFVPGREFTVFESAHSSQHTAHSTQTVLKFSVLVCFEDIFPGLARRFAREGAQALAVITNDAWFGPTAAAYQHAQASTLRAVELRRPVVRAANTGWSGCIDAAGRWGPRVADAQGAELFVPGVQTCEVMPGTERTPYARLGDWLPFLCLLVTVAWGVRKLLK